MSSYHVGANSLQGGKRSYNPKVLIGNNVEDKLDPSFKRTAGGSRLANAGRFMTTSGVQQADGSTAAPNKYGMGLPEMRKGGYASKNIDYNNIINYDKGQSGATWKSVGKSTYGKSNQTEFKTSYAGREGPSQESLDEYRGRWTQETEVMRKQRYQTEQTSMQAKAVPSAFTASVLRELPGEPKIVEKVRKQIMDTGRGQGIRGMARMLKIMDDSGDGVLSKDELKWGLGDYGIDLEGQELDELFTAFDRDRSGTINFDEFLVVMRGPMNNRRLNLVGLAFDILDKTGDGQVTIEDIKGTYDTSKHPDVISGKCSEDECLNNFMGQWDGMTGKDGVVTRGEFAEYYRDSSASIDSDDYFELMIRNAWHISGGEGAMENTTCRRVLVKHADGHQSVEEIKNDLGLDPTDIPEMIRRLKRQGIDAVSIKLSG